MATRRARSPCAEPSESHFQSSSEHEIEAQNRVCGKEMGNNGSSRKKKDKKSSGDSSDSENDDRAVDNEGGK